MRAKATGAGGDAGYALVLATIFATIFAGLALTVSSINANKWTQHVDLSNRQLAENAALSAMNYSLALVRRGGITDFTQANIPFGPTGTSGYGQARFDIRVLQTAFSRIDVYTRGIAGEVGANATERSADARRTKQVVNMHAIVRTGKYIPSAPLYFGNGAVEHPKGNYEGASVQSYISNTKPFFVSAWNHPLNHIVTATAMATPPTTNARWRDQNPLSPRYGMNFNVFESQTSFGKLNVTDFLDPWVSGSTTYNMDLGNGVSGNRIERMPGVDPYPTMSLNPDVETFALDVYSRRAALNALELTPSQVRSGTYVSNSSASNGLGTITNPRVVIVNGAFQNETGPFEGAGILVIKDDWAPGQSGTRNVTTPNVTGISNPKQARLDIRRTFKWTGMVIVTGWAPNISTANIATNMTATTQIAINGTLMGEDAVQSGGELSLEQATIQLYMGDANNDNKPWPQFNVFFSKDAFEETLEGGATNPMFGLLPQVEKTIMGMELSRGGTTPPWGVPTGWSP